MTHLINDKNYKMKCVFLASFFALLMLSFSPFSFGQSLKKIKTLTYQDPEKIKQCIDITARVGANLRDIARFLNPKFSNLDPTNPFKRALSITPEGCQGESYRETMEKVSVAASIHDVKIGVILPRSGAKEKVSLSILDGIRQAVKSMGLSFEEKVIVLESKSTPEGALEALAELMFVHKVSMVMAGIEMPVIEKLSYYAQKIYMPMIAFTNHYEGAPKNPYTFYIYPDPRVLASFLAKATIDRGFKKVAILKPKNKSDEMIAPYQQLLISKGVQVSLFNYIPGEYSSMDETVKSLKDIDAVYIPDHFRSVRFFMSLFKYYDIKNIGLIGSFEWRSKEMLSPWEDSLEGAIFADFISSYHKLPLSLTLQEKEKDDEFLVPSDVAEGIDLKIAAYRAGRMALQSSMIPGIKRFKIAKKLQHYEDDAGFFEKMKGFNEDRIAIWPSYLFRIGIKRLVLIEER